MNFYNIIYRVYKLKKTILIIKNFNYIKVMIKAVFSIIMKKLREDTSLIFLLRELGKYIKSYLRNVVIKC